MLWGLFRPRRAFDNPSRQGTHPIQEALEQMAKHVADVAASGGQNEIHDADRDTGLRFERCFTPPGSHAYDLVEWERRTAAITNEKGALIFEQRDVEVPKSWSQLATNVVAQKYFRGHLGGQDREHSVRQLIDRVVTTVGRWGREGGYFAADGDAANFEEELRWLLVTQHASFNSPVWFNIGVPGRAQQSSACFINSVQDTMESILELAKTEGMLFKFGSGTGTNMSVLRSSKESLAGGGTASGPVSFMRGYDSFAGSIKSGGTTRRAAKMVILNADHPDLLEFVNCKAEEEKKAWALIEAGYDAGFNVPGGAYDSVQFQNANHSVRVSDEFMRAVERDGEWTVKAVTDGRPLESHRARDIWKAMADAAWICGDPGVQFDTTIQDWNCVPNTGGINATNPCFTGDALVHTNKGLIAFKELFDRVNRGELFKVYTHDLTNPDAPADRVVLTSPDAFMVTGYHEVARLSFSNGMEVRCTPNHRFFTRNRGYVRADELTEDDRVLTLNHGPGAIDARYELPVSCDAADHRAKGDHFGFRLHTKADRLARMLTKEQYRTDTTTRLVQRTPDGVALTYNLSEPRNHSYVVNGLVVANCSEFVFVDDTACNLLSLNLLKYQDGDGRFNVERLQRAVDICFTAQEILVSNASYPTPAIARNSERLRPLGLGYANLGALLMSMGLAYDSDEGRRYAGAITAIMTGRAYAQSARMAEVKGPFAEFELNREPMLRVMAKHRAAAYELRTGDDSDEVVTAARAIWDDAIALGERHGYRNAQSTVIAPTGTIGLMMDCDTTGIEPDLALVKYKKLVGGGLLKIVNGTVPQALRKLGYDDGQVKEIVEYIDEHDTIEGAPHLQDQHLKVFDCAFKPVNGVRSIAPMGHVHMMAGVQPFISGSQSKTVNLPTEATVEDIANTYLESWKLGLKCIAIYRDGCKRSQPLSTSRTDTKDTRTVAVVEPPTVPRPVRRRLPDERHSLTHHFDIQGHEGYVTVGLYDDGTPGEIFLTMAKEGSTISGLMDAFALQTSMALQHGAPLRTMVNKFSHVRFEPSGFTKNPEIPIAKSIIDYIFRWLASRFLDPEDQEAVGILRRDPNLTAKPQPALAPASQPAAAGPKPASCAANGASGPSSGAQKLTFVVNADSPACPDCGSITVRNGACYKCMNCGSTTGCS
jgi:ribonucleotide reductase alpha subunit